MLTTGSPTTTPRSTARRRTASNAKARIFLTDGGHNVGDYANGHQGGPPTYVIGFSGASFGTDGERLRQIASDTGGRAFLETSTFNLQAVMNEIGTRRSRASRRRRRSKYVFARAGQSRAHGVSIASRARTAQLTLLWSSPLYSFTIGQVRVVKRGRVVAVV